MFDLLGSTYRSFRHGIHPHDYKELTRDLPLERMPFMNELILPVSQHLGAPSEPVVRPGDRVRRGQLIAEARGFVSSPMHAPATGVVRAIEPHNHPSGQVVDAIVIEPDPASPQTLIDDEPRDPSAMSPEQLVSFVQSGGFVGLGGAAFPTHVKLSVPEGKKARFFIVNAAECEPYLNSDFRVLLEKTDAIFRGMDVFMRALGAERAYIGIETNKPEAVAALEAAMPRGWGDDLRNDGPVGTPGSAGAGMACEIVQLETKYPQGAEKMLIEAVLHREVPSGRLPIDMEVVVNNVGTVAGIGEMVAHGQPLIERVVTVTGPGIRRPSNLIIPLGTKLSDVIDFCDGMHEDTRQILFGGPMMGSAQRFLDVPIMKGTSGVLFLTDRQVLPREEYPCIKCMRCIDACPVYLNPSRLGALARARHYEDMLNYNVMDCMECGSCSYVCPSNIPLVQRFRVAKGLLREQQQREKEEAARKAADAASAGGAEAA